MIKESDSGEKNDNMNHVGRSKDEIASTIV